MFQRRKGVELLFATISLAFFMTLLDVVTDGSLFSIIAMVLLLAASFRLGRDFKKGQ